jgi:hypothetical protein
MQEKKQASAGQCMPKELPLPDGGPQVSNAIGL